MAQPSTWAPLFGRSYPIDFEVVGTSPLVLPAAGQSWADVLSTRGTEGPEAYGDACRD